MKKFRIYIDMDDTIVDFKGAYSKAKKHNPLQVFPQSQIGFFVGLEPIEGAIEAITALKALGHEIYILTAPSVFNPLSYTEKRLSIEKLLGFEACYSLIICNDKSLLKGDILIDDRTDSHKQDKFEGTLLQFHPEKNNWDSIYQTIVDASV